MYTPNYPVNLLTAYLLWGLGFFGLCGVHRFYLGRPVSGAIWFFTFGGFFIGQFIVDPFLIPSLVRERNRQQEPVQLSAHPMRDLLKAAKEHGNVLSLSQVIISTNLSPDEAQKLLLDAIKKDLAHVDNDPTTGAVRYYFDV
jgi:hypothetical protein